MITGEILSAGFRDAVFEAQAVFKALLDAMAEPGTIRPVRGIEGVPRPLTPVAGAVLATLCDADTPLWLCPAIASAGPAREWLAFHVGAPVAPTQGEAQFAICMGGAGLPSLDAFAQGTQEYPDRSTTVVIMVETLRNGEAMRLEGPGIASSRDFSPGPLPGHFREMWRQNRSRFPRGVDLVFAGPGAVACLPRTTRILAED